MRVDRSRAMTMGTALRQLAAPLDPISVLLVQSRAPLPPLHPPPPPPPPPVLPLLASVEKKASGIRRIQMILERDV